MSTTDLLLALVVPLDPSEFCNQSTSDFRRIFLTLRHSAHMRGVHTQPPRNAGIEPSMKTVLSEKGLSAIWKTPRHGVGFYFAFPEDESGIPILLDIGWILAMSLFRRSIVYVTRLFSYSC
jgi:hypothetical protein